MSRLKRADQVLFLSSEQPACLGNPQELYRHQPSYRQLVDTQERLEECLYG